MSRTGRRFSFRRGGNARLFLDPLGWGAYGRAWPFIWFARKFTPGSRLNEWGYNQSDRIHWRKIKKALRG